MRILNSTTLHGWSAGSWYAIEMMRGLGARGHDIHFLVPEGRTARAAAAAGFTLHDGPDLRRIPVGSTRRTCRQLRDLRAGIGPDLVIAHNGADHSWWGLIQKMGGQDKSPPLVRLRAHDPRPPASHPLARWLSRSRTSAFIVASESQRRAHVARFRSRPGTIFRIPPGFAPAHAAERPNGRRIRNLCGVDRETILVSSIARFAPQKDHPTFFTAADLAARALPGEKFHFLVAGYPAEYSSDTIREMAAIHPALEGRWTLFDERLEEGWELVGATDIGVVHSRASEAICRVAMEYMSDHVPVVAAKTGSLPELIVDGVTGLLVDRGDAASMAGAITRLIRSAGLRTRLTGAAAERVRSVFDHDRAVDRLENRLMLIAGTEAGGGA